MDSKRNIEYSYMTNYWGHIKFKQINNFDEWYIGENNGTYYYLDWDKVLRYYAGAGIKGIELMVFNVPDIIATFGSMKNFKEFAYERGIERITGMFSHHPGAEDKRNHKEIFQFEQKAIDALAECDGINMIIQPVGQYYGVGPLDQEHLQNVADCMNTVGRMCADKGLVASIHNEFWLAVNKYDHERFLDMTDPRYVSYCLDTAQVAIMGVDIHKFYDDYHDRIQYFHLKDTRRPAAPDSERFCHGAEFTEDGSRWFWEPGAGNIDFPRLWHQLKKYQHKGWVGVEIDGTPDPLGTTLLTKQYITSVLDPIYH
jgi:inosose dehydratase